MSFILNNLTMDRNVQFLWKDLKFKYCPTVWEGFWIDY